MEKKLGAVATFFLLAGEDAAQVKAALEKAKLAAPKERSRSFGQARIFEDYGVWYDALRIAANSSPRTQTMLKRKPSTIHW